MAKKAGQKIRILFVLDILKRLSDEAHPITAEDICAELEKLGLEAERKAIYADISALGEYGFDIIKSGYPRGFFLGAREFEEPEIYILADAVRTAKFISPVKTRELVGKLDSFLSVSRRRHSGNFPECRSEIVPPSKSEGVCNILNAVLRCDKHPLCPLDFCVPGVFVDRKASLFFKPPGQIVSGVAYAARKILSGQLFP